MSKEREQQMLRAAVASGMTSPKELANFMAQVSHESGGLNSLNEGFRYTKGSDYIAAKVPSALCHGRLELESARLEALKGHPEHLAELMYGGRMGNNEPGEGFKYHGRGYIQLTGKDMYRKAGQALQMDLVKHPELASDPENASKIAVWYWQKHVQKNHRENVTKACHDINNGENGLPDRKHRFDHWQQVITPELIDKSKVGKLGQPIAAQQAHSASDHTAHHAPNERAHKHLAPHHPLINEAGHPSHPLYEQIKAQTDKLGGAKALGFHSDKEYIQALANMTYQAKLSGMAHVDHVVETTNKQNLVMIQGGLHDPVQQREISNKTQASHVPVEQSTQQLQQDVQQMQMEQHHVQRHYQQTSQTR